MRSSHRHQLTSVVENNSLSKKDKLNIIDINPMLRIGVEGADGELLNRGGGIAKNGKTSLTAKDNLIASANQPINGQGMSAAARAWEKHAGGGDCSWVIKKYEE